MGRTKGRDKERSPRVQHSWEGFTGTALLDSADAPQVMEEEHLDCQGRKRLFRLTEQFFGSFAFLQAEEIRKGQPTGWRFRVRYDPEREVPPYYQLRKRLDERLGTRDLVCDPDSKRLQVMNMLIRAQVGFTEDPSVEGPPVIVDGEIISWRKFGEILASYEGWGLRIQITEEGEE